MINNLAFSANIVALDQLPERTNLGTLQAIGQA
jgi:hypothetical protein